MHQAACCHLRQPPCRANKHAGAARAADSTVQAHRFDYINTRVGTSMHHFFVPQLAARLSRVAAQQCWQHAKHRSNQDLQRVRGSNAGCCKLPRSLCMTHRQKAPLGFHFLTGSCQVCAGHPAALAKPTQCIWAERAQPISCTTRPTPEFLPRTPDQSNNVLATVRQSLLFTTVASVWVGDTAGSG